MINTSKIPKKYKDKRFQKLEIDRAIIIAMTLGFSVVCLFQQCLWFNAETKFFQHFCLLPLLVSFYLVQSVVCRDNVFPLTSITINFDAAKT